VTWPSTRGKRRGAKGIGTAGGRSAREKKTGSRGKKGFPLLQKGNAATERDFLLRMSKSRTKSRGGEITSLRGPNYADFLNARNKTFNQKSFVERGREPGKERRAGVEGR